MRLSSSRCKQSVSKEDRMDGVLRRPLVTRRPSVRARRWFSLVRLAREGHAGGACDLLIRSLGDFVQDGLSGSAEQPGDRPIVQAFVDGRCRRHCCIVGATPRGRLVLTGSSVGARCGSCARSCRRDRSPRGLLIRLHRLGALAGPTRDGEQCLMRTADTQGGRPSDADNCLLADPATRGSAKVRDSL